MNSQKKKSGGESNHSTASAVTQSPTIDPSIAPNSSPASSASQNPDGSHPSSAPNRTPSIALNPRSCVTCRKRKVRCDKQQPCSNCVRARIPCQFPAPGRAPRRPRKPPDGELLARLRKLEGVVKSLGATADDESLINSATTLDKPLNHSETANTSGESQHHHGEDGHGRQRMSSLDNNFGRLVLDHGKSRYVNNNFWANLSNEVEDIKSILHDESDLENEPLSPGTSPSMSPGSHQTFVFHSASPDHERNLVFPPPNVIQLYWDKYVENVDPLVKMLHLPSMRNLISKIKEDPAAIPRHHEPLIWSIFYASVTSLSCEELRTTVGEDKLIIQSQYRRAVERSLAKEHFLSTEEVVVLQALVLFLLSLRRNEHPRVLWSLTGLIVRIAMTMGLHRDGSYFDLSLFDTEVRRRLWWQICNLDVRLSEDHGSDPGILEHSFDTQYPLNINDTEFGPDMPETTTDQQGVTDMTFSLIRFEVANTFRRLSYCPPRSESSKEKWPHFKIEEKEQWIEECHRSLEEKYLRYCDMTIPMHWVIGTVARLIMAKMWLLIYQPYQRLDGGASLSQDTRDRLFITSLESIEYALLLEKEVRTVKWGWLFKSYSQWHALAFLLSELCHRTKGPTVHRAWLAIDQTILEMQNRVPHHRREAIWRPLGRLLTKAKAARENEVSMDNTMSQSSNPWAHANGKNETPWDPQTVSRANAFGTGTGYEKQAISPTSRIDLSGDVKPSKDANMTDSSGTSNGNTSPTSTNMTHPTPSSIIPSHFDPNWSLPIPSTCVNNSTSIPEFAPSPFFANQPPVQPPAWTTQASGTDNALLNDFFMGESFGRTGTTPGPTNSTSVQPFPKEMGALNDISMRNNSSRPFVPNVNGAENPMVSGADAGQGEPIVQWDAWDDMVREFEMETDGPGQPRNNIDMAGFAGFGAAAAGAGAQKRPGPGVGDVWF